MEMEVSDRRKTCEKRLRFTWQPVMIGILMVMLFCGVTGGVLFAQIIKQQRELQHMAKNIKLLQIKISEQEQLLNSTHQNFTLLGRERGQLELLMNATWYNLTLLSDENSQLSLLLNESQQTSMELEAQNQHQRSILFSSKLSFLWRFCNKDTLQCSRCPPGWVEHASRCFFLSQEAEQWEEARRKCLDMGADLAVVWNAEDQAFLTNFTFEFAQQHPKANFHSAWIGLRDMVREGVHTWVNGNKIHTDVTYWKPLEPNNAIAPWDKDQAGQDCVAIVPPSHRGEENWLDSWDDIICLGKRHYLCETPALSLS